MKMITGRLSAVRKKQQMISDANRAQQMQPPPTPVTGPQITETFTITLTGGVVTTICTTYVAPTSTPLPTTTAQTTSPTTTPQNSSMPPTPNSSVPSGTTSVPTPSSVPASSWTASPSWYPKLRKY